MSKPHKDLPGGSQAWADEVDALMAENRQLREVVKRLCANAGIDYSNPSRGINSGDTPSVKNPVNQKLSSLADTDTYNVADGQYLAWNQKGQKWLPITPPAAGGGGGTVDISAVSYSGLSEGYGAVTSATEYAYTAAGIKDNPTGPDFYNTETWATTVQYIGAGNWDTGPVSLVELAADGFGRPYVQITAEDYADGTAGYLIVSAYSVRVSQVVFYTLRCTTANRPTDLDASSQNRGAMVYDTTINKPIWWNGTAWTDALGTVV